MAEQALIGVGRNTAINLASLLVPLAVSLVTVPLYLNEIGEARFGVLALAWLLLGYFGLFDFGLGRAVANRIARLQADPADRPVVMWTAAAVNVVLGTIGAVCLFVAGNVILGSLVEMPDQIEEEVLAGLPWLAAALPFFTVSLVWVGVLEGLERFALANSVELVAILAYQTAPLFVAYAVGADLRWLLAAAAVAPVLSALVGLLACTYSVGRAGRRFDRAQAGALLRYGGWVSVTGLISPLLTVVDRFVIGAVSGVRAVTHYTVPYNLVTRLIVVPVAVSRSIFPRLSRLSDADAKRLGLWSVRWTATLTTPLVVLGAALLEPFLVLWVGEDLARASAPAGAILLFGVWLNSLNFVPYVSLQARGRPDLPAKFHLAELLPYVVALWLALDWAGIEGVAAVWVLRVAVDGALVFVAAGLAVDVLRGLLFPAALVGAAVVGALTLFEDPTLRVLIGAALVAVSTAWALRASVSRAKDQRGDLYGHP